MLGQDEFFGLFVPAFCVFAQDIDFDVERAAGGQGVEAGGRVGVGDDGYFYLVADDGGDCEADAFDGDGALGYDVAGEGFGKLDAEAPVGLWCVGSDGSDGDKGCGAVDVALDDVASEGRAGGCGEFEVQDGVGAEMDEGGAGDCLGGEVG